MTIKEVEGAVELLLKPPQVVTPYIHGKSGIGKSSICAQIAERMDIGFIDLRLSQLESSDLRGIPTPDYENGSSRWLPPETIPFENFAEFYIPGTTRKFSDGGILLLDEINRARFDVLQAVFELVWDRRVGLHKLLDNWFLVCAGNLGEDDHTEVTEFDDAALNNRFIHYYVEDQGLFDCWMEWAEGPGNVHSDVIGFIKGKPSVLYTDMKENEVVFCTPRTWDNFSKILKQNSEMDPSAITSMIGKAYLGHVAVGFLAYLRQKSKITPSDVVNKYPDFKKKIAALSRDEKYALSNEVVTFLKDHKKVHDGILDNVNMFVMNDLEKDHMIAIYKILVNLVVTYRDQRGKTRETEFMDPYLDRYPDLNEKIAQILKESKKNEKE